MFSFLVNLFQKKKVSPGIINRSTKILSDTPKINKPKYTIKIITKNKSLIISRKNNPNLHRYYCIYSKQISGKISIIKEIKRDIYN